MFNDDEKVFGPLTLKQFIHVAIGFSLLYFPYTYLELKVAIPLMVLGIIIFFKAFIIRNAEPFDENYIKAKRYHYKNLEDFQRWLKMMIAECRSQIEIRRTRGLIADPELEKKALMLEAALRDIK